ncbi:MAG: amidohydrolase family protein, partial [Phycisphaerae bacterium]
PARPRPPPPPAPPAATPAHLLQPPAPAPPSGAADFWAQRAGVAVRGGRIEAVGMAEELRGRFAGARETSVVGVMVPGLVNAHTHLELGYQRARAGERYGYFTEWVGALMRNYPPAGEVEGMVRRAVREGREESLRFGVTTVGDISRHCAWTREELKGGPLRVVSFGEVIGLGKMRGRAEGLLEEAADRAAESESLRVGLSPHAPYTVEAGTLRAVVARSLRDRLPLTMHLSELREEGDFLRDFTGKLSEWGVLRNLWDERIELCEEGAIGWAEGCGLLRFAREVPVVLGHVNYCNEREMELLVRSGASVVYCPRTAEYFGHSGHRYREMMDVGINVCLGTDSLASTPDLSVLKEAALLVERDGVPPYRAMEMITVNGGKALGADGGVIDPKRRADVAVFPLGVRGTAAETLAQLFAMTPSPVGVWAAGARVV